MPPFREGPIQVDRQFDGEALHELRDIGHGHRINIVDASYDIPRGAKVINFPGTSADALLGVVRLIPIEDGMVDVMERDAHFQEGDPQGEGISARASHAFEEVDITASQEGAEIQLFWTSRNGETPEGEPEEGFYDIANNAKSSLFIRTIDDLPFACASLVVGHSQRTE